MYPFSVSFRAPFIRPNLTSEPVRSRRPAAGLLALAATCLVLQACSSVSGSGIDYESARSREPLDVPPNLLAPDRNERFDVPGISGQTLSSYEKEQTTTRKNRGQSGVLVQVPDVQVERDGAQTWLRVSKSPEEIWPIIHEFWQENGFVFAVDRPEIGILETDWAENRARVPNDYLRNVLGKIFDSLYSLGERDRYRTRLERNADGTTDIFVSHRGLVEVVASSQFDEQTRWQNRPTDPSLEAEFLKRLMLRFGQDDPVKLAEVEAGDDAQPTAATPAASAKVVMLDTDAGKRLQLREGFDRAWRNVGLALDRTGFTVEDRDRSIGTYFVRYIDSENPEQERPGFIARFFGADEPEAALQKYRIIVEDKAGVSEIGVLPPEGTAKFSTESAATAGRMLGLIEQQLRR